MNRMKQIKVFFNINSRTQLRGKCSVEFMSQSVSRRVREFHRLFPDYQPTPLQSLRQLAKKVNVDKIWIKDESFRFGLNAFKVLGGSYAIGVYLSKLIGVDEGDFSFELLKSQEYKEKVGNLTFITATDGNHGRGVAWSAKVFGQEAVVFMPKGSSKYRINNIKKENAEVVVTNEYYDETVKIAANFARENNGVLIQDTAWKGYVEIPTLIMQGYSTLIDEIMEDLEKQGESLPTHVFLQAGVGSLAAAIQGYLITRFGDNRPLTVIIEPHNAACLYKSVKKGDKKPHSVKGSLSTIMAGLACGKPNILALEVLRDYADFFVSCSDEIAAKGMRVLGNPLVNDPKVISGESGAVGLGLLIEILENKLFSGFKEKMNLTEDSRILVISTEGDTDPDHYRNVVWDGKYPSR
ncbi:MAG: diaminopropionate ammonia-lyase [Candidatus Lokiarchaeota archaeon]|nr:diaminopropionate ammonia-lyase [Candidatus Lokiarchaeota archaeon]